MTSGGVGDIRVPPELDLFGHKESDMIFLGHRLNSFTNWPFDDDPEAVCSSQKMAEAGLFFTSGDAVKCAVCLKELDGWEPTDDPMNEHRAHSRNCPFVQLNKAEHEWLVEDFLNLVAARHAAMAKKWAEELVAQAAKQSSEIVQKVLNAKNKSMAPGGNTSSNRG